jgi:hypothetical protein
VKKKKRREEKRRQLHEIEGKMCKLPIIQIIAKIDQICKTII